MATVQDITTNELPEITTLEANDHILVDSSSGTGRVTPQTLTNQIQGNLHAATAKKLETARTINGTPFDGSANVTIHVDTQNDPDYWDNYVANSILAWGNWQNHIAIEALKSAASPTTLELTPEDYGDTMDSLDGEGTPVETQVGPIEAETSGESIDTFQQESTSDGTIETDTQPTLELDSGNQETETTEETFGPLDDTEVNSSER